MSQPPYDPAPGDPYRPGGEDPYSRPLPPQGGDAQPGYQQPGFDQQGYDQPGYDQPGYDQQQGYPQPGYQQQSGGLRGGGLFPFPHRSFQTRRGTQVTVGGCCLPLPLGCLTTLAAAGTVAAVKIARSR